ncbi:MAG: lytic murein transglycosylase [Dongiaceae bacterium]
MTFELQRSNAMIGLAAMVVVSVGLAGCQSTGAVKKQAPAAATLASDAAPAESSSDGAVIAALPSFDLWRADLKAEALAAGVSANTFDRAFALVQVNQDILAKDQSQAEFTRPVWEYLDKAVSEARVENGKMLENANAAALAKVERRYGVPPRIIIAIWGLESSYGEFAGDYNVIEALATLAYASRRGNVFRAQLIDALLILDKGDVAASDMRGSWAGAMGQTQFMPSAFRQYAVDGDGDGRRNIWRSLPDVFSSTGNYLASHGWRPGEPWGAEVRLPPDFPWQMAEVDIRKPVEEWRRMGVRLANGRQLPKVGSNAAIVAPAGHRGPVFILFDNFRVILKYNNSTAYGLAVALLSDRVDGGGPVLTAWPTDEPPLSKDERLDLQTLLAELGYDPGEIDGVVGPMTRAAVRRFQRKIGMVPDGYPTPRLLGRLRAAGAT